MVEEELARHEPGADLAVELHEETKIGRVLMRGER